MSSTLNANVCDGVTTGVSSLLAQFSPSRQQYGGQQSSDRPVRVRARTIINFAIFIVALIGGLIALFVRLMTGANVNYRGEPSSYDPQAAAPVAAAGTIATHPPVAKPMQTGNRKKWNAGTILAVVMGVGVFLLASIGLTMFLILSMMSTPLANNDAPFSPEQEELLAKLSATEDSDGGFQERWQASPQASGISSTPFGELVPPRVPLPLTEWDKSDLVASGIAITHQGMSFDDTAKPGGVLVGFRVTGRRDRLQSIQPIYQLDDQYILGEVHGTQSTERVAQFLAAPGDIVAAVRLDLGGRIEGIQVEFARIVDGQMDSTSKYTSQFFGREVPRSAVVIEGDGNVFVGIAGKIRDGFDGFYLKRNMVLSTCEVDLRTVKMNGKTTLARAGSDSGNKFNELAPEGGLLVGMRIFIGRSWGGAIQAVQPIYQVGSDYLLGKRYGSDGGLAHQVIARPGYAIGKIDARAGLVLNSVKFTFQRVTGSGLDSSDGYDSERFGSPGGGQFNLDSSGRFIVGVGGSFEVDMISLEVVVTEL